jgi:hypothetical protein
VIVGGSTDGPLVWPAADQPAEPLTPVIEGLHATSVLSALDVNAGGQILLAAVIDNLYHAVVLTPTG